VRLVSPHTLPIRQVLSNFRGPVENAADVHPGTGLFVNCESRNTTLNVRGFGEELHLEEDNY
jgi:hypothetical protein